MYTERFNGFELRDSYEATRKEQEEKRLTKLESRRESARLKEQSLKEFDTFKNDVQDYLVMEALSYIPVHKDVLESSESRAKCKNTICNFVKENDSYNILNTMTRKTRLLSEMANIIESTHKSIIEKCNPCDKSTFEIKDSDRLSFYKSLDRLSTDKVAAKIRDRVAKATDDFIQGNMNDKLDMEATAEKIKDQINKSKEPTDEVKQEYARLYNREVNEKRSSRPKNVLETMTNSLAKAIVKDEKYRNDFISESGKLNMDKIIDVSIGAFCALESLNTINLISMDRDTVKELVDGIK